MDRHNVGFVLFLVTLLLVPELPLGRAGVVDSSVSLGAVGLGFWLLISRITIGSVWSRHQLSVSLLILYAVYLLVVSVLSGNIPSIAYALQYAYYALLAGLLIPAYLTLKLKRNQLHHPFTIFASIGILYGLGILISLWSGPLTFTEVRNVKRIEGLEVVRGVGFAEAVTVAGGVAAVFAGFQLFVWSHLTRMGPLMMLFGPAALIATLSRSAIVSFTASLAALGMLLMARAAHVRSVRTGGLRRAFQFVGVLILCLSVPLTWLLFDYTARSDIITAVGGLGGKATVAASEAEARWEHWRNGLELWASKPVFEQVLGAGFRNSATVSRNRAFVTSHNSYIEMLNDAGLVGLALFLGALFVAFARLGLQLLLRGSNPVAAFCLVSLTTLSLHAGTEVVLYHPAVLSLLIFVLSVAGLLYRQPSLRFSIQRCAGGTLYRDGMSVRAELYHRPYATRTGARGEERNVGTH